MKKVSRYFVVQTGLIIVLYGSIVSTESLAEVAESTSAEKNISLRTENFEHIKFKRIKANNYTFQNQQLKINVDNSSSFLLMPFDQAQVINQISFQWRSIGEPAIRSAEHEEKRDGDDAVFKVALLLKADKRSFTSAFNPLIPAWMKHVDKLLTLPSEEMVYLVVGAKHAAGQHWVNPYNDRVQMVSMKNKIGSNGWVNASYTFKRPLEVVGLWLMSDGDNTHSKFTATVKNIVVN